MASLEAIPEGEQVEVEGLNKAIYKPRYWANVQWYRQGEMQVTTMPFLVVDHGPFELLLSSRRFAPEAERRMFALPLVRPRKTRGENNTDKDELRLITGSRTNRSRACNVKTKTRGGQKVGGGCPALCDSHEEPGGWPCIHSQHNTRERGSRG